MRKMKMRRIFLDLEPAYLHKTEREIIY